MPFESSKQMRAAFGGYLGSEMKSKAAAWAHETPNIKGLPEHVKKKVLKRSIKRHVGKGGPIPTPFVQAAMPIDLLKVKGEPPTAKSTSNT